MAGNRIDNTDSAKSDTYDRMVITSAVDGDGKIIKNSSSNSITFAFDGGTLGWVYDGRDMFPDGLEGFSYEFRVFNCTLDNNTLYDPCVSPITFRNLSSTFHNFMVEGQTVFVTPNSTFSAMPLIPVNFSWNITKG